MEKTRVAHYVPRSESQVRHENLQKYINDKPIFASVVFSVIHSLIMAWVNGQKTSYKNKISHTLSISPRSFIWYITLARVKYCLFSEYLNLSLLFEPFRHRARKNSAFGDRKRSKKVFSYLNSPAKSVKFIFSFQRIFSFILLFVIKNIYICTG